MVKLPDDELFLVFAEAQGNYIPMYTFHKLDRKFDLQQPTVITLTTNKKETIFFKYNIKASLSDLSKITKDEGLKQIHILCFGDTYLKLTGDESTKYIEPSLEKKINIFNIFYFMPFTTITVDNFFLQLGEEFCNYRLKYLFSNVPVISLKNNKIALELSNQLTKIYLNKKITSIDNFNFSKNSLLHINYFKFFDYLNDNNFYIPKLTNMNKINTKITVTQEDIIINSVDYQKLEFLLKTYDGVIKLEKIELNTNIKNTKALNTIISINKLIGFNNFISFHLLKNLLNDYPDYIKTIKTDEIYLSSVIDVKKMMKENSPEYNFNFIIEMFKHDIYKFIVTQILVYKQIHFLTMENQIDSFGIFVNQCLCYFNKREKIVNLQDFYIHSIDNKETEED